MREREEDSSERQTELLRAGTEQLSRHDVVCSSDIAPDMLA